MTPYYTEFYDEVLQKEFHLTLVKENADIQLTPLFAPRFRVSETLKKSIYILGESIYVQRNKPIQKILALFGTLHIPVRYVPTWFKTLCGLWDMYILCFFGLKQLERLAKQKNALLIGTNRPQARFAKMLSMPFFIPTFHK